jgi:hypothetical protein
MSAISYYKTEGPPAYKVRSVSFRSNGHDCLITNKKIWSLIEHLGFFLDGQCWFERTDEGAKLERELTGQKIIYSTRSLSDRIKVASAIAFMRHQHFTHRRVFALKRRYTYEKYGDLLERAQSVVCFDVDGHNGEDTKAAVKALCSLFPVVKFIEYSPRSKGYHVYFQLDRPVFDYSLVNIEAHLARLGFNVEAIKSTGHIRFPMSRNYSIYGLYNPKKGSLVQRFDLDALLTYWESHDMSSYFPPEFEADFSMFDEHQKITKKTKKGVSDLVQKLIDNTHLDYGPGNRDAQTKRILSYCIKYGLDCQAFTDICTSHNKGARGKTDFFGLYQWGLKNFEHTPGQTGARYDYDNIMQRIDWLATIAELPPWMDKYLRESIESSLIKFLSVRPNACKNGTFKNESLIKERYYRLA